MYNNQCQRKKERKVCCHKCDRSNEIYEFRNEVSYIVVIKGFSMCQKTFHNKKKRKIKVFLKKRLLLTYISSLRNCVYVCNTYIYIYEKKESSKSHFFIILYIVLLKHIDRSCVCEKLKWRLFDKMIGLSNVLLETVTDNDNGGVQKSYISDIWIILTLGCEIHIVNLIHTTHTHR